MNQHVGKTIESIELQGIKGHDDVPILVLRFTDGSNLLLYAVFGGYSGASYDEYPCYIVEGVPEDLNTELYIADIFTGE